MNHHRTSSERPYSPILVIGLDGATFDLIVPWAEEGVLPTFARLLDEGAWGPLRSTIPPMSPEAWPSFATGTNPGKHGIFGFRTRRNGTYTWFPTSLAQRQCPTMWGYAGRRGRQVGVFNVPLTYPPEPIPGGYMVSGMGVPDVDVDFTWPPLLKKALLVHFRANQLVECTRFDSPSSHIRYLLRTTDDNLAIVRFLLQRYPETDLLCATFVVPDRVQHYYWSQMEDPFAPEEQRNAIRQVYQRLDVAVGTLLAEHPEHTLIIMSDHGFGPFHRTVSVNNLLASRGWLHWAVSQTQTKQVAQTWRSLYHKLGSLMPNGLAQWLKTHLPSKLMAQLRRSTDHQVLPLDWRRTQAYSVYDIGAGDAIYLNLQGREPLGCVRPGEDAAALLSEIEASLRELRDPDTGQIVVDEVYRKSDLYHGGAADQAPDLVISWKDGYCGGVVASQFCEGVFQDRPRSDYLKLVLSGTHRLRGILMAAGPGIRPRMRLSETAIVDLAPTILHLLALPVPDNMDGQVIEELLDSATVNWPVSYACSEEPDEQHMDSVYTDVEQEMVEERLRDLGYLK